MDKLIKLVGNKLKDGKTLKVCKDLVKNYNITDYKKYKSFSDVNYKKNLVYRNDVFEMYVVCWTPYQGTPKHDHSDKGCIFKVLEGNILEYKYFNDGKKIYYQHNVGSTGYIDNEMGIHIMKNESKTDCVSFHIYSPPKYSMKIYK